RPERIEVGAEGVLPSHPQQELGRSRSGTEGQDEPRRFTRRLATVEHAFILVAKNDLHSFPIRAGRTRAPCRTPRAPSIQAGCRAWMMERSRRSLELATSLVGRKRL